MNIQGGVANERMFSLKRIFVYLSEFNISPSDTCTRRRKRHYATTIRSASVEVVSLSSLGSLTKICLVKLAVALIKIV